MLDRSRFTDVNVTLYPTQPPIPKEDGKHHKNHLVMSWQLFYLKAPFFFFNSLHNGIFLLNVSSKTMKGYIIIFFLVSVFLTITSLIIFTVEDKEDQRSIARTIGSVVGAIAASAHIYYLVDNYGLDWIPWFIQNKISNTGYHRYLSIWFSLH